MGRLVISPITKQIMYTSTCEKIAYNTIEGIKKEVDHSDDYLDYDGLKGVCNTLRMITPELIFDNKCVLLFDELLKSMTRSLSFEAVRKLLTDHNYDFRENRLVVYKDFEAMKARKTKAIESERLKRSKSLESRKVSLIKTCKKEVSNLLVELFDRLSYFYPNATNETFLEVLDDTIQSNLKESILILGHLFYTGDLLGQLFMSSRETAAGEDGLPQNHVIRQQMALRTFKIINLNVSSMLDIKVNNGSLNDFSHAIATMIDRLQGLEDVHHNILSTPSGQHIVGILDRYAEAAVELDNDDFGNHLDSNESEAELESNESYNVEDEPGVDNTETDTVQLIHVATNKPYSDDGLKSDTIGIIQGYKA